MHHLVVEAWSRASSPIHARDARAKLLATLVFVVVVSTTSSTAAFYGDLLLLAAAIGIARLPLGALLARAALLLPFIATFVIVTWWSGQPGRALVLFERSALSGIAALILVATTPINRLVAALESLKVPRPLTLVIQFLYRYLFVISEQAQHMRLAARARGSRFHSARGAIAVLFARSWERADGIHRAMLARGFSGRFSPLTPTPFKLADTVFAVASSAAVIGLRLTL